MKLSRDEMVAFVAGIMGREFRMLIDGLILIPIARFVSTHISSRFPLHFIPFSHYLHHPGRLKRCQKALCQVIQ